MSKIAIIGGGAAGLVAAIVASQNGAKVTLFEQNGTVGKKILASGNGRCNISNTHMSAAYFSGHDTEFAEEVLRRFDYPAFEKFFRSLGLWVESREDGRTYPRSNEAKSVLAVLNTALQQSGATVVTEAPIDTITGNEGLFTLTGNRQYNGFEKVLLATGSEAAPQLGGNDTGYRMATSLGHTLFEPYAALVQLHLEGTLHKKMAGLRQDAEVALYIDGKKELSKRGDVLFTQYGISGLAVLDVSQKASQALLYEQQVAVGVNLFPDTTRQMLSSQLQQSAKALPHYTLFQLLSGLLPLKLLPPLFQASGVEGESRVASLSPKAIKSVVNILFDWRFEVNATHGFRHAEVSGGGISTFEIDAKTMESTRVKGLYFAGEMLDIVGERGGYNLHFAWASGYVAGKSLSQKVL